MVITALQERLYEAVKGAALAGETCPTNRALAQRSGLVSASTVADALGRLERKGLIEVRHVHGKRVIRLREMGIETAVPAPPSRCPRSAAMSESALADLRTAERKRLFPEPAVSRALVRGQLWTPHACQYIAGEPTIDDDAKCGAAVRPGSAYCPFHHRLCHSPPKARSPEGGRRFTLPDWPRRGVA